MDDRPHVCVASSLKPSPSSSIWNQDSAWEYVPAPPPSSSPSPFSAAPVFVLAVSAPFSSSSSSSPSSSSSSLSMSLHHSPLPASPLSLSSAPASDAVAAASFAPAPACLRFAPGVCLPGNATTTITATAAAPGPGSGRWRAACGALLGWAAGEVATRWHRQQGGGERQEGGEFAWDVALAQRQGPMQAGGEGEGEGEGAQVELLQGQGTFLFARLNDRHRGYVPPPSLKKIEYYSVRRVRPDGRCMFRALVQGMATNKGMNLGEDEETAEADELRLAVAEALCHSEKRRSLYEEALIAITLEESLKRYCQRILRSDFWGGESELLVLSRMCSQPIIVYIPESKATREGSRWGSGFVPIAEYGSEFQRGSKTRKARQPVRLLYNGVNHYDLLL